jgi:hypothetical protein
MLRLFAGLSLLLTGADHWTTYLCLRAPVAGWEVTEANPFADWLFGFVGLVPGLAVDSLVTLCAVAFLLTTAVLSSQVKTGFLCLITLTTGFAVFNNVQAIQTMGLLATGHS